MYDKNTLVSYINLKKNLLKIVFSILRSGGSTNNINLLISCIFRDNMRKQI